jgi:hypothetical protein
MLISAASRSEAALTSLAGLTETGAPSLASVCACSVATARSTSSDGSDEAASLSPLLRKALQARLVATSKLTKRRRERFFIDHFPVS